MSDSTPSRLPPAAPFWMSVVMLPLVALAAAWGGLWWMLLPAYAWYLTTALDGVLGLNEDNPDPQTETARLAQLYAQYRLLAASNQLIECLNVQMPSAAYRNERERFDVNPIPAHDLQENSYPLPAMGPPAPGVGR